MIHFKLFEEFKKEPVFSKESALKWYNRIKKDPDLLPAGPVMSDSVYKKYKMSVDKVVDKYKKDLYPQEFDYIKELLYDLPFEIGDVENENKKIDETPEEKKKRLSDKRWERERTKSEESWKNEKDRIRNMSEKEFDIYARNAWNKYESKIKNSEDSIPYWEFKSELIDTYGRKQPGD